MIRISAVTDAAGARSYVANIAGHLSNRRGLNQALAGRLAEELQDHWRAKNATPNKLGGERTNFWGKAAKETAVVDVTEDGATVAVGGDAGTRIRIHLFGGTITPKAAQYLAIPIVREAHGLRPFEYEQKTGHELFTIPGRSVLFEALNAGGSESRVTAAKGRSRTAEGRTTTIPLAARQQLRPVFALAKRAKIPADPDVMPPEAEIVAALQEEADDWMQLTGQSP